MRNCYIVTYDLINPGRNYDGLLQTLKNNYAWARLGGSSYLILSDQSAVEIRNNLTQLIAHGDTLYVGLMSDVAAWYGLSDEVSNWILNNQK